jgi:hypothetical protein
VAKADAQTDRYLEKARKFQPCYYFDDYRHPDASPNGGIKLENPETTQKMRNALKKLIYEVGRKILLGNFDLSQVSYPIECLEPRSVLDMYAEVARPIAVYLNAAAQSTDALFRMKMVMTSAVAFMKHCHEFCKPFNPILGETYQAILADGSRVNVEQICHHPPVAAIIIDGPRNLYRFTGTCELAPLPSLNSMRLRVRGFKQVEFADGTTIRYDNY